MRAGGCTVLQQTLSGEAASVVKYAVSIARRRGHGQVTPLHVAITMLQGYCPTSGGVNLMRSACLQSHSHPLQCRALELCFNVALNRLPTSSAGPTVHGAGAGVTPSLSNALVAAFKRAQAIQRRGCVEHQPQQPLLAVKVEMEQLIMSILDDPSVSRVMREAGFSSPQIKKNLEEALTSISMPKRKLDHMATPNMSVIRAKPLSWQNPQLYFRSPETLQPLPERLPTMNLSYRNEDVMAVVDNLMSAKKLRNTVIVGESLFGAENVVNDIIVRMHRGDMPEPLRSVHFINPQFSCAWFGVLNRDYVEQNLVELKRTVSNAVCEGRGAIVYLGDLRWVMEGNVIRDANYCPVNHVTMELGRILSSHADSRRLWLMATATYQTYLRFQKRQPSLETMWGFHPVPVPAGSLGLNLDSRDQNVMTRREKHCIQELLGSNPELKTPNDDDDESGKQPSCCEEYCSAKLQDCELQSLNSTSSTLPSWLREHNNDNIRFQAIRTSAETVPRERSSQICRSIHGPAETQFRLIPVSSPDHSTLACNTEDGLMLMSSTYPRNQVWSKVQSHDPAWSEFGLPLHSSCPPAKVRYISSSTESSVWNIKTHQFRIVNENEMADLQEKHDNSTKQVVLHEDVDVGTTLALGRPSCNNKANHGIRIQELTSCSNYTCYPLPVSIETASPESDASSEKYKQLDVESFKTLCRGLEEKVAWQREIIPSIVSTVLRCRSGVKRKHGNIISINTWFLFLGSDKLGQIGIAKGLAEIIFGSQNKIICINPQSTFTWDKQSHSEPDETNATSNANVADSGFYLGELMKAIRSNPHSVIVLEEIHQSDSLSMEGITKAMEMGTLLNPNGDEISLSDAIIIMTSSIESRKFIPSNLSEKVMEGFEEEKYLSSSMKELVFQGGSIWRTLNSPAGSVPTARGSYVEIQHHQSTELGSPRKRKADDEGEHEENSFEKRNKNSSTDFSLDLNISAQENEGDNVSSDTAPQVLLHHHRCFPTGFLKLVDKSITF